jgi:thiol-disulfide isomerase/thioredoxin
MKFLRYGLLAVAIIGLGMSLGYIVFQPADSHDHDADAVAAADGTGSHAAALVLEKPEGGTIAFADLEGDILILDFWATWCAPCISEIPHYNELHADYEDKGVHMIGVTLESGSAEEVVAFAKDPAHAILYPLVMGNDEVVDKYGPVWGFPTTVLVGPDGKVLKTWLGPAAGKTDQLRELIDDLLENAATTD